MMTKARTGRSCRRRGLARLRLGQLQIRLVWIGKQQFQADRHVGRADLAHGQIDLIKAAADNVLLKRHTPLEGGPAHEEYGSARLGDLIQKEVRL